MLQEKLSILWSFYSTGPHGEWGIENLTFSILKDSPEVTGLWANGNYKYDLTKVQ